MSTEKRYRWDYPLEWLLEKADQWDHIQLLTEFKNLARKLDSDQIQDEYENDMDQDGFFDEVHSHQKQTAEGLVKFDGKAEDCPICEEEQAE